jgi:hypothetical protein
VTKTRPTVGRADYRGAVVEPVEEPLLIRVEGRLGRITLNRPRQINALTFPMIIGIRRAPDEWFEDPTLAVALLAHPDPAARDAGRTLAGMAPTSVKVGHRRRRGRLLRGRLRLMMGGPASATSVRNPRAVDLEGSLIGSNSKDQSLHNSVL